MEFKVNRNIFLDGIQKTLGIVEKKTTTPILNNVLLKAEASKIKIIATDREISLISDYEADIAENGEITLSAKKLFEMVREIQGDTVHFTKSANNIVKVTCQRATYKIPGLPADDFPSVADSQQVEFFNIPGSVLKELISKTSFAMAFDESRKNLNGVLLETSSDGKNHIWRMVATDGHRLAVARAQTADPCPEMAKGIIIPRKGLMEVKKLTDVHENVSVGIHKNMFVVKTENTILKVNLVDADYPDYKRVIPAEKGVSVTLDKELFLHALRRMNVVSSERYSGVIISIAPDKMTLNSTNLDVGEATEEIDITYSGEEMEVGFNVNYVIDAVSAISIDRVVMEVGVGLKPTLIKPAEGDNYLCIVMPLKI
ncbi:MAG: DNA polymerase III subunit beta [Smithellaceae bacterium]|jgi:DNA polymerase-3 subunit beta|nr:DNA polymerase III subunit beta [Smithellaceae bacterium]MDD3260037.1 DNA polymerase III subunit beta [Smithellaceae bacterium]MDD3849055.1 DNA polymerase III subunit beta [Smithellaceae bacterium]HOQ71753.1 DNA polymerase III subunit beta [Smithellaceae bacterium]HPL10199.1 DNA polymerase III subunit beta [Smithellaceae bacterium]